MKRGERLNVVTIGKYRTLDEAFAVWNSKKPKIAARIIERGDDGSMKEITRSSWGWTQR